MWLEGLIAPRHGESSLGIQPISPALADSPLTTGSPGKSLFPSFCSRKWQVGYLIVSQTCVAQPFTLGTNCLPGTHVSAVPQCVGEAGDGARLSVTLSVSLTSSRFLRGCPLTCSHEPCSSGFASCEVNVIFGLHLFFLSNFLIGLYVLSCFSHVQLFRILWTLTPGSSVHVILLARTLEWVAMPPSRGSSQPRDQTQVSCGPCIPGGFFTTTTTREAP